MGRGGGAERQKRRRLHSRWYAHASCPIHTLRLQLAVAGRTHDNLSTEDVAHDLERLLHLLLRGEVEHGAADDLIPRVPATQQRETRRVPTARNKRLQQREITGFEQTKQDCIASGQVRYGRVTPLL